MKKKSLFILLFLAFLLTLITYRFYFNEDVLEITFENGQKIYVEVPETNEAKSLGLMYRENLDEDAGMIFIYPEEFILSFWMKNTLIPLDIIFLNKNKEIVMIKTMKPCVTETCESYLSEFPSMYAIEVNEGFALKNNLLLSQKVNFR